MKEHDQMAEATEKKAAPKRPSVFDVDPEKEQAKEAGLSVEEFRAVKAAQARLWPLGQ